MLISSTNMFFHIGVILIVILYINASESNYAFEHESIPINNELNSWKIQHINRRDSSQNIRSKMQLDNFAKVEMDNTHSENASTLSLKDSESHKDKKNISMSKQQVDTKANSVENTTKSKDGELTNIQIGNANAEISKDGAGSITVTDEVKIKNTNKTVNTTTITSEASNILPLNDRGVVKRGLIVFGGFALMAVAYFIFHRGKGKNYDSNNVHNNSDSNQFRYGVLQSDERRDNIELSRIPLTMESDDDDEEDLEIFDLEQKKKSLSYVNLQTNDEDIVFCNSNESKNNLLLDIEEGPSDMINWSSSGNKSIL